jgi:hypothetical protein
MKKIAFCLLLLPCILFSQEVAKKKSVFDFNLRANHLVREQFFSLSINYPIKKFYFEAEYGYYYYHHAGLYIGYKFNLENIRPYLTSGAFYNRENFTKNTHYDEYCLKFGGGIEFKLLGNFFFNFETAFLNYLSINYSLRKIKYRRTYDFGESSDYSVSIGLGYHFQF